MRAVASERWQKAQQHELEFWQRWREIVPYRNLDLDRCWAGECARHLCIVRSTTVRRTFDIPLRDRLRPSCGKYLAAGLVLSVTSELLW